MPAPSRRSFLASAASAAVTLPGVARAASRSPNEKIVLALMGAHNRGSQLAKRFSSVGNVEIAYVCDPDQRQLGKGVAAATWEGGSTPKAVADFREALDDPSVDALICAAPNHWHAAATILSCQAGKHVYVEKPCSHTAAEGELMIAAAEQAGTVVQVGMQRRSGPLYQEAVDRVRSGAIGKVLLGKSFYYNNRPSVGAATAQAPPNWLDYDLWQGPAQAQPYRSNILPYTWHNFWHWGNGEIGNNGVHTIDICRWAMEVDLPDSVSVIGRKLRHDDDQETPDTMIASFGCGDKQIVWEGVSWSYPYQTGRQIGIELRGSEGTLFVNDSGWTIYDANRDVVESRQASRGDQEHLEQFAACIREGHRPNASLTEGHRSVMFCHLANMAYRAGQNFRVDPSDGRPVDCLAAQQLWDEPHRDKWMPTV